MLLLIVRILTGDRKTKVDLILGESRLLATKLLAHDTTHSLRDFGVRGGVSGEIVPAGVQRPTRSRIMLADKELPEKGSEKRSEI